jgi:O-antigen/teichoic acid export membrane protein
VTASTVNRRRLGHDSLAISTGFAVRALALAGMFVIVARTLRVEDFGALAALQALSGAAALFVGLGTQLRLVRDLAGGRGTFSATWGVTLAAMLLSMPIALTLYFTAATLLLPSELQSRAIWLIGAADILVMPFGNVAMQVYQGHARITGSALVTTLPSIAKLGAALLLMLLAPASPESPLLLWALLYAAASVAAAALIQAMVHRDFGPPKRLPARMLGQAIKQSWAFLAAIVLGKLNVDIDKALLARLGSLEAAGAYNAAYRVLDLACIPLQGFAHAALPRQLAAEGGPETGRDLLAGLLRAPTLYALLAGAGLYASAPLLPWVLGADFGETTAILRGFALLPLLLTLSLLLRNTLIALDAQRLIAGALAIAVLSNTLLNLLLIPPFGWVGALTATYVSESMAVLLMLVQVLRRTEAAALCGPGDG